jgi:sucrose-6F-phosphate phosphohydrolase
MLATDLDGTFIGDRRAMSELWAALDDAAVLVVFSTGRHLSSIEDFYKEVGTARRPAACVAMVGTEIWHRRSDHYVLDQSWRDLIAGGWDRTGIEAAMSEVPNVVLQPIQWQSSLKASFYLESASDARVAGIHASLARAGLEAKIVYSADRFLDLLPPQSGKGEAVRYLADSMDVSPQDVVTAGDTGNDLDMMRPELGFRSVVVGNASRELLVGAPSHAYRAESAFAAGIREGLEHFGWLEPVR